jgi:large subunit ribosomal protein L17
MKGKKLGRNFNERKSLWTAQVRSMFIYGKIKTTQAKVKSVAPIIEKLCSDINTFADLDARRLLYTFLQNRTWVNNVYTTFKKEFGEQKSNFTKSLKLYRRYGDDALMVELSFVKPITFSKDKIRPLAEKKIEKKIVVKKEELKNGPKNKRTKGK